MTAPQTQFTLLAKLRNPTDDAAWRRFETNYRELVVRFGTRQGLQPADAEDVAQTVFASMVSALQGFTYDPAKGRFRDYLFRAARNEVARHKTRKSCPSGAPNALSTGDLSAVADPSTDDSGDSQRAFEDEWIDHHFRTALVEIRKTHSPESVAIFERLVNGASIESTAAAFATTPSAVHKVKQRIRDRMREVIERQIAEEGP